MSDITAIDKYGRGWKLIGLEPYTRKRDGVQIQLAVWETPCPVCSGGYITVKTPEKLRNLQYSKSCDVKACTDCKAEGADLV